MSRLAFSLPAFALVIGCSAQPTDPTIPPDLAKGGGGGTPAPASIVVSPASSTIIPGQTVQLTATGYDRRGNALACVVVTWSSGDDAVATVSAGGLVTGLVAGGPVTITARYGKKGPSGTAGVVVEQLGLIPPSDLVAGLPEIHFDNGITRGWRIGLTWADNSLSEAGFRVERCTGEGCTDFAEIAAVGENAQSYTDSVQHSSGESRPTYRYRVRAYSADGNSEYSNTVTVSGGA